MISKEEFVMIHTLKSRGYSMRAIAKATGLDRRTVSKRLKEKELKGYKKRVYASILDSYKPYIDNRIEQAYPDKLPATVIYEEIRSKGYKGSLRVVQRYIRSLSPKPKPEPIVRFETDPGYQAQADWTVLRGGKEPLYAFVMVLGYSRMAFVYCSDNMSQESWQACHEKAFCYFGGIPETILYDNLKSVVIERDRYGKGRHGFNNAFLDFCKERFMPKLCQPYRAQTKGKVERFNRYLKESFYIPLKTALKGSGITIDAELLNSHLFAWLERANRRVHTTTQARPIELFEQKEKKRLKPFIKPIEPLESIDKGAEHAFIANSLKEVTITYETTLADYDAMLKDTHAYT